MHTTYQAFSLGAWDLVVNQTNTIPAFVELLFWPTREELGIELGRQISKYMFSVLKCSEKK